MKSEGRAISDKPVKVAVTSNIGPDNLSAVIEAIGGGPIWYCIWNIE